MAIESKETRFGKVFRLNGGCKDDWKTIATSRYYRKTSGLIRRRLRRVPITMQKPALDALRRAEERAGTEITVTGSSRSCEFQAALHARDSARYAAPSVGLHCQALAIDQNMENQTHSPETKEALLHVGFTQSRPSDEPWHWSFGWTA